MKSWLDLPYKKIEIGKGHKMRCVLIGGIHVHKCKVCGGELLGTYNKHIREE